ncbi:ANR family transcriptional regulator [Photobacterium makurazakiensis]|uniref:ANR family transcriptional regulator n=1 Tax=Photobacterium makurazakiensis TaxID=2910234 RepID=UPI003D132E01
MENKYLNAANLAAEFERENDYINAAEHWDLASNYASPSFYHWTESRKKYCLMVLKREQAVHEERIARRERMKERRKINI